ncbi:MAG TPA: hypothetical protein VGH87_08945 [Polyangiaceae bacterium]|jgi:hypothetical protein
MKRGRIVLVAVAAAALFAVVWAAADDRTTVEQGIAEIEKDPHQKELCADPLEKAKAAQERAKRMRVAGDEKHAKLTDGLALEWTRVAQELVRADALETRAHDARALAADAGAHVERERATLEQQLAENGRLQAELAKLESKDGGK